MIIDSYSFGKMIVEGESYSNDLKVFPNKVEPDWWRDRGHLLQKSDLEDVLEHSPDLLVIGIGANGRMGVSQEVKEILKQRSIDFVVERTQKAKDHYNNSEVEDKVGVFHLTC